MAAATYLIEKGFTATAVNASEILKLERELGSYGRWVIHEYISFRTNTTSAPDQIRDGKSGLVLSVTRVAPDCSPSHFARIVLAQLVTWLSTLILPFRRTPHPLRPQLRATWTVRGISTRVPFRSFAPARSPVRPRWTRTPHVRISITLTGSISSVGTDAA